MKGTDALLRILIGVNSITQWRELSLLAKELTQAGHRVFTVLDTDESAEQEVRRDCLDAGLPLVSESRNNKGQRMPEGADRRSKCSTPGVVKDLAPGVKSRRRVQRLLRQAAHRTRLSGHNVAGALIRYTRRVQQLKRSRAFASIALDRFKPDAIIVGEDGLGGMHGLLAAARHRGVPIAVVPYELSTVSQAELFASTQVWSEWSSSVAYKFTVFFFPKWIRPIDGRLRLRTSPAEVWALRSLGMEPRDPWTVHGGHADVILVDSAAVSAIYEGELRDPHRIRVTGSAAHDVLARRHASRACPKTGMGGPRRVVVAFPPDYHTLRGEHTPFSSYLEAIRAWHTTVQAVCTLTEKGGPSVDVVFQVHPRVSDVELEKFGLGLHVTREPLLDLLADCDVLVASCTSGIRHALAIGIPVINYDLYQFRHPEYASDPNVVSVDTLSELGAALQFHLSPEPTAASAEAPRLSTSMSDQDVTSTYLRWGTLDGLGVTRIVEELTSLRLP